MTVSDPKAHYVRSLFSKVPYEYDLLLSLLTFRQDQHWRTKVVSITSPRDYALDVATGTGLLATDLARSLPANGLVVGVDLTLSMLKTARKRLRDKDLQHRVDWVLARAENLPFRSESFDSATISLALRNVSSARDTLVEMSRSTRPDGTVASLDFTRPNNPFFKIIYYDYLLGIFPLLGRIISKAWGDTLAYLGRSILRARTGEQVSKLMTNVGLENSRHVSLTMGIVNIVYGKKR